MIEDTVHEVRRVFYSGGRRKRFRRRNLVDHDQEPDTISCRAMPRGAGGTGPEEEPEVL